MKSEFWLLPLSTKDKKTQKHCWTQSTSKFLFSLRNKFKNTRNSVNADSTLRSLLTKTHPKQYFSTSLLLKYKKKRIFPVQQRDSNFTSSSDQETSISPITKAKEEKKRKEKKIEPWGQELNRLLPPWNYCIGMKRTTLTPKPGGESPRPPFAPSPPLYQEGERKREV